MRLREDAIESRLETLLLRAIGSCESRNGKGPTVLELAADLGITPDFGHTQLVELLRHELSAGCVSHYRSRFSLTAAGRQNVEGHTPRLQSRQQADLSGENTPNEASLNLT
jgi:hypothetical protein